MTTDDKNNNPNVINFKQSKKRVLRDRKARMNGASGKSSSSNNSLKFVDYAKFALFLVVMTWLLKQCNMA
jgi:hypothetical protein